MPSVHKKSADFAPLGIVGKLWPQLKDTKLVNRIQMRLTQT